MSILLIFCGFLCGLIASYFQFVPKQTSAVINAFIINVALPCVILLKVPALTLDANALTPMVSAWAVILGSALVIYLASRYFSWSPAITGALLLCVPLSNSAYLGLPIIDAVFNDATVGYAIIYDQFGNFFGLAIYGPIIIAMMSAQGKPVNLWHVMRKIITFAPFPVMLVALLLLDANTLPTSMQRLLIYPAATMGPLAGFIVGLAVRLKIPRDLHSPLLVGLSVKLLIAPFIVLVLAKIVTLHPAAVNASIAQAAMPTMITAGLMGIAAGFSERLIVAMIGISAALSVITLPAWYLLIG